MSNEENPKVLIILGSDSDLPIAEPAMDTLKKLGVRFEIAVSSAHRSPERTRRLVDEAPAKGIEVIVAFAGMAAHLAGVVSSETILPVIGVPVAASLDGLDALLSTVQMPGGVPVATMSIGKAGAKNAAFFAARILALSNPDLVARLEENRRQMAREVEEKSAKLEERCRG